MHYVKSLWMLAPTPTPSSPDRSKCWSRPTGRRRWCLRRRTAARTIRRSSCRPRTSTPSHSAGPKTPMSTNCSPPHRPRGRRCSGRSFPRAFIDPNREPFELDPAMFEGALPDYANTSSPRVAAGLGTIARVVCSGAEIYGRKIGVDRRAQPDRRLLPTLPSRHLSRTDRRRPRRAIRLCAMLFDCHSMPSVGGPMDKDPGLKRVDFVLGDCHGATCNRADIGFHRRPILKQLRLCRHAQRAVCRRFHDAPLRPAGRPASTSFKSRSTAPSTWTRRPMSGGPISATLTGHMERTGHGADREGLVVYRDQWIRRLSRLAPTVRDAIEDDLASRSARSTPTIVAARRLGSFEEIGPGSSRRSSERWRAIRSVDLPYLVAELGGWHTRLCLCCAAYGAATRAYRHTVEDSIYIDPGWHRHGIGSGLLLRDLIERCEDARLPPDGRGHRRFRQHVPSIGLHEALRVLAGRDTDGGRLQVRPLGRHRSDATAAWAQARHQLPTGRSNSLADAATGPLRPQARKRAASRMRGPSVREETPKKCVYGKVRHKRRRLARHCTICSPRKVSFAIENRYLA